MRLKLIILLGALLATLNASAQTFEYTYNGKNLSYSITSSVDKTVEVIKNDNYKSFSGSLDIPESVTYNSTTYTVVSIGFQAFSHCSDLASISVPNSVISIGNYAFSNCSGLTSIDIPDSVTSIGESAFSGCTSLTSIDIPDSVILIGESAFSFCSSLTSIYIPSSVTFIDKYTFCDCYSLTSIDIPASVTSIGDNAFMACYLLASIDIPNSVISIGAYVFNGCSSLGSIDIPTSVTSIGDQAFDGCSNLTSIEIPNSVISLGSNPFSACSSLKSFTGKFASEDNRCLIADGVLNSFAPAGLTSYEIPNSVTSIGDYAFSYCSSLTSIDIPDTVTSIDNAAFTGCSKLTSIDIPATVTNIGNSAFYGCSKLTSIDIPDSVTSIGGYTFSGCSGLTSIDIPDSVTSIGDEAFVMCSGLTSIDISGTVTSIGNYAFNDCRSLTSIDIPASLTSIGNYAFYGCWSLTSVTVLVDDPKDISLGSSVFDGGPTYKSTLYVPKGSKALYEVADQWKNFGNIVEIQLYTYTLVEGEAYTNDTDEVYETITYTRSCSNTAWKALYLPFNIPYEVWSELGVIVEFTGATPNGNGAKLEFTRVNGDASANTPYLFLPKEAGDVTFTVSNATLKVAPTTEASVSQATSEYTFTLYGNYVNKGGLYALGAYALSTEGQFVQADNAEQVLKPYRIYMTVENGNSHAMPAPATISVTVDGEATGIEDIEIFQQVDGRCYDLLGRPVFNPQHGIFIRGGEKVIIK